MVRSIAANHALADGNKRLALTVLHSTLLTNGYGYLWQDDQAVVLVLRAASGDTDFRWLSRFIAFWTFSLSGVEIPLDRHELSRGLVEMREALSQAWKQLADEAAWDVTGAISKMAEGETTEEEERFLAGFRNVLATSNPARWSKVV